MEVKTKVVGVEEVSGVKERQQDTVRERGCWGGWRNREEPDIEKTYAVITNSVLHTHLF